MIFISKTV